ncbi:MAG TPA: hypothetical protein VLZ05_25410 [Mycobacterium sp.]|nr:hypothetical protein [Mycobacterium sp.]HUH71906.1 hypothetical protein [Mycobacterium sp.]
MDPSAQPWLDQNVGNALGNVFGEVVGNGDWSRRLGPQSRSYQVIQYPSPDSRRNLGEFGLSATVPTPYILKHIVPARPKNPLYQTYEGRFASRFADGECGTPVITFLERAGGIARSTVSVDDRRARSHPLPV